MHRITRSLAAVAVLALVVGSFTATASAGTNTGSTGSAKKVLATLQIEKPKVEVKKKGSDTFKVAKDGQKLREGDTVRTDATGLAEIDYSDDAYTRLDVNTTFKITKLTEEEGARQIEGSLDSGQTWNRVEDVSESGSFEQSGAGATAAITGTAFMFTCITATSCSLITAESTVVMESDENGDVRWVPQNGLCTSEQGTLCGETRILTNDEMAAIAWLQANLLKDLVRGFGNGPFQTSGVLVVENGQVVSFTPVSNTPPGTAATTGTTSSTGSQSGNPSNPNPPPPPPPAPIINADFPILVDYGGGNLATEELLACPEPMQSCEPASQLTVETGETVLFAVNLDEGVETTGLFVVFDAVPAAAVGRTCDNPSQECNDVSTGQQYAVTQVFSFTGGQNEGSGEIRYHIEDAQGNVIDTSPAIPVDVVCTYCELATIDATPTTMPNRGPQPAATVESPPPTDSAPPAPEPEPESEPTESEPPPEEPATNQPPPGSDEPEEQPPSIEPGS